jgi:hypothetical protein
MAQVAEDLGLEAEALDAMRRRETDAQRLERHRAPREVLERLEHGAHAPRAEHALQPVVTDARARFRLRRAQQACGIGQRVGGGLVQPQQALDLGAHLDVGRAALQPGGALEGGELERRAEELAHSPPRLRLHPRRPAYRAHRYSLSKGSRNSTERSIAPCPRSG